MKRKSRGTMSLADQRAGRPRAHGSAQALAALLGGVAALVAPLVSAFAASAPSLPGAVEPGHERPLPPAAPESNYDFTIETPHRSPVPRAVDELRFELKDIVINGATVFPPETLKPLWAPLIGKQVGLSDILTIADEIEAKYHQAGYIISRAYVPPQHVGNGVFTINVVEGYVSGVAVEGGDPGIHNLIAGYLQPVLRQQPLDAGSMERALLLANDLPGVQVSGLLRPSPDRPGASDLVATVDQTPFTGGLGIDNRGSRFTDVWTLSGDVEWNSPLGDGDQLAANIQMAPDDPGQRVQGQAHYQHPVGTNGMLGSMNVVVAHGVPSGLGNNVVTDSLAAGPRLTYPILRSRAENLSIDGGFTYQDAEIDFGGATLSHDHWRVADIAAIYSQNGFWNGATNATFDVAQGIPGLGASANGSRTLSRPGAHTDFTKLTAALRRVQTVYGPVSFSLIGQGQYSFDPLVAGEQITFGGMGSGTITSVGRGYDPSAITGDHGVGGSAELRYDKRFGDFVVQTVEPYVFYDTAKIWNRLSNTGSGQALASTGLGVRITLPYNITGDFEFVRTLKAVSGSDDGHKTSKLLVNAAVRF